MLVGLDRRAVRLEAGGALFIKFDDWHSTNNATLSARWICRAVIIRRCRYDSTVIQVGSPSRTPYSNA